MVSLFSYLITFMAVLFWIFRVIVTIMFDWGKDFFAVPLNEYLEIAVIFATLPCLLLVIKRNIIGAAAYLGIYAAYFGTALYESITKINESGVTIADSANLACVVAGIVIAVLVFIDVLFNKNRSLGKSNKKADWFYDNKDYDREFDERADRNQYRI